MRILIIYVAIFFIAMAGYYGIRRFITGRFATKSADSTSLKTVTFGDESAVAANRAASVISVVTIFLIWGAFTGSSLVPFHAPGPYVGETSFTYRAVDARGETDEAVIHVRVHPVGEEVDLPAIPEDGEGFARDDAIKVGAWRTSRPLKAHHNDDGGREAGYRILAVEGHPIAPLGAVSVADGEVRMTAKGSLVFEPDKGWQMEPIWLPAPEAVWARLTEIAREGYQNVTLAENLGWSLFRVIVGFALGCLVGIPLGYAMGLSGWFRGWFDPIVEFMRPVPPLALIPLIIIWFGIWETGKISLLFLAALWIMIIAARAGVSGVNITKVHAAYSLGASKFQVLTRVIVPNSLPEIFTGARVAMGVCWGTVVAAELVAAEKGAGKMIITASKFQNTDIVIMGVILIGIIGYGIDILMRKAENRLVPWKGRS
uniref:Taurine transport system permease protein n=1 Tax=Candidatus Kentrum eta TaxID=2126337 RepID=A0A450VDS3_9GAMM|nr:MAG: taurine transport system permease protein [Candidatus Kentron sp. H]VFJ97797.1 MAG: taurine transport system permease protein [Candidatus Kentron sp. H]VFK02972.1 MAG: taurine transport system permease protein [Candidatus Kentron sp. H]